MKRGNVHLDDVRLEYVEFGGDGPGLLLLHGLFGRATTWASTAAWLTPHFRVVALDQRGHGRSDKPDDAYRREDYIQDAAEVIQRLGLEPAVVVGHSMGALNAWVLAAQRPDLVRALVLLDMTPALRDDGDGDWMYTWPQPFPTMGHVRAYFDGLRPGLADYFQEVMAEDPDGYRSLCQPEHMQQSYRGMLSREWWAELEQVRCPALVVKGELSSMTPRSELQEGARRLPQGRYAEVLGAYHVVHYDQPDRWRAAVEPFLLEMTGLAGTGDPGVSTRRIHPRL